jgi:integrase
MTQFQAKAREGGMKLTTIGRHLRHIKAALRWAERQGMFAKAPTIEMPKLPKGQALMKHRPVTGEEFDRLVEAAPQVRPQDSLAWVRLLRGLWLSGLRLSEAVALSWDEGEPFHLDVSGKYPAFRIMPEGQKSRQPEIAPTTPDFAAWLLVEFPDEGQRAGRVFRVDNLKTGKPIDSHHVGRLVAKIGRKAGVVVGTTEKAVKVEGKPVKKTVKLFATAHDWRRGFCTRWSRKVMPAVLQRLARHAHISTTMSYYVSSTADEIGADLWAAWGKGGSDQAQGNISGNIAPKTTQGVGTHEGT